MGSCARLDLGAVLDDHVNLQLTEWLAWVYLLQEATDTGFLVLASVALQFESAKWQIDVWASILRGDVDLCFDSALAIVAHLNHYEGWCLFLHLVPANSGRCGGLVHLYSFIGGLVLGPGHGLEPRSCLDLLIKNRQIEDTCWVAEHPVSGDFE